MFTLKDKTSGEVVKMRDGRPFVYSSRFLAQLGRKVLEADRKIGIRIVEAK